MEQQHIVKSYDEDLAKLEAMIVEMGGLVEAQLTGALTALERSDTELAAEIVAKDRKLDDLEQAVEADAIRLIALRQPMAEDLRIIVTALKISSNLERMGDYAKNVAKRVDALSQLPALRDPIHSIKKMSEIALAMVHEVLDSFIERDVQLALAVIERDRDVDRLYTGLYRENLTYMMENPRNIAACTHLMFAAKNIERIGDHATNIAEQVHFMLLGKLPDMDRPKSDHTAQVLAPKED